MTNQLQGEILFGGWVGGTSPGDEIKWAYTPWIPVRGDFATFGVEVLAISTLTLTWEVQTRNLEDPSVVNMILSGSQTINTVTTGFVVNSTAAKQLVRYRFKTGASSLTDYVHFRALQPSWQADR